MVPLVEFLSFCFSKDSRLTVLFVCVCVGGRVVDINPDGRSYASGAEDGYVRLHMFDKEYLEMKDPVPEEDDDEDDDEEPDNEGDNNNT